jgi:hypothetical protein
MNGTYTQRLIKSLRDSWKPAMKSVVFLLKITIPVSLTVTALNYLGVITAIAEYMNPLFKWVGLPGQSGVVIITSMLLNIYSAIAAMSSLTFNMREATILSLMCLISHNLITETIIQRKTGSNAVQILIVRISASILSAILLNMLLPDSLSEKLNQQVQTKQTTGLTEVMWNWLGDISYLSLKIIIIVNGLMFLQKALYEFKLYDFISKLIYPIIRIMGLPQKTSFLWIIGNVVGLAYGGAIMIDETDQGKLSKSDCNVLNHHLAISHSTLEDTLLYMAIGVPAFWILLPRVGLAMLYVWAGRVTRFLLLVSGFWFLVF